MKIVRNPRFAIAGIAVCIVLFYLAGTRDMFGRFFNQFSPCVQNVVVAYPCYIGYDIAVMLLCLIVGAVFLVLLGFSAWHRYFKRR